MGADGVVKIADFGASSMLKDVAQGSIQVCAFESVHVSLYVCTCEFVGGWRWFVVGCLRVPVGVLVLRAYVFRVFFYFFRKTGQ